VTETAANRPMTNNTAPSDLETAEAIATVKTAADEVVKRFNTVMGSHRRLTPSDYAALAGGETVKIASGSAERPIIELSLRFSDSKITHSVQVDQSLMPRMRAQALALADKFQKNEG